MIIPRVRYHRNYDIQSDPRLKQGERLRENERVPGKEMGGKERLTENEGAEIQSQELEYLERIITGTTTITMKGSTCCTMLSLLAYYSTTMATRLALRLTFCA